MDNIIENFLKLTKKTVPSGKEYKIFPLLKELCLYPLQQDTYGNFYLSIGKSSTLFISHLDTVGQKEIDVKHIITPKWIKTDGSILGGDNKAGVVIMLDMIQNNVPGHYWFVLKEEVGCLGSSYIRDKTPEKLEGIKRAIAFDRRDRSSVVTFMRNRRTCSDEFADTLISKLKDKTGLPWRKDPTGISADTASFMDIVPECTNISTGVYGEHTSNEALDIEWFTKLTRACSEIDWENLPSKRDITRLDSIPEPLFDQEDFEDNKIISSDDIKYSTINNSEEPTNKELLDLWNYQYPDDELYKLSKDEIEEIYPLWRLRKEKCINLDNLLNRFNFYAIEKINILKPTRYRYIKGNKNIDAYIDDDGDITFNNRVIGDNKSALKFIESFLGKGDQLMIRYNDIITVNDKKVNILDIELSDEEIKFSLEIDKQIFFVYYDNSSKAIFKKSTKPKGQKENLVDVLNIKEQEELKGLLHKEAIKKFDGLIKTYIPYIPMEIPKKKKKKIKNFEDFITHD